MELGSAVAIVGTVFGITIPVCVIILKGRNGKGICAIHQTLVDDISEIKQDVKELIKQVAGLGG